MPESARAFFEPRLGVSLSQVRLHTGAEADGTARELNAQAFTAGRDIFFAAGQYKPEASEGKRLLAHELAHVAQQGESAGRGAQFIHRQTTNPLKGRSPSEVVDYRAQSPIDDALQQSSLWKYIGSKFVQGTRVGSGGGVKYLPRKDFETAAATQVRAGEDVKTVGGFYDRDKDKIVLPERPLLESMLHETIHKFADASFQSQFGLPLNEAVTQYFTNFVLQEFGLGRGSGYTKEVVAGEAMAQMVGHEELALGYFLGPSSFVGDILRNKIPHFQQGNLVNASIQRSVDWNHIAEMILGTRPIP